MRRGIVLFGICSVGLFGACESDATGPGDEVVFSAVVQDFLEVPIAPGTIDRILVTHPGETKPADRSIVHISKATTIVRRLPTGETAPAAIKDIEPGQIATFQIEPIELRSYPRQVFAARIEL